MTRFFAWTVFLLGVLFFVLPLVGILTAITVGVVVVGAAVA